MIQARKNERYIYLDQMKGIAILWVVIGHVMLFSFGVKETELSQMLSIFHMPVFFFISGYLAYKVLPDIKVVGKRLIQKGHALLFPYWVFAGLYCVCKQRNFVHLLMIGGAEYWFLYVLFLLTSFFILYGWWVSRIKNTYCYVVAWLVPYVVLLFIKYEFEELSGYLSIN